MIASRRFDPRMRLLSRRVAALVLACALAAPHLALAQEPPAPADAGLGGSWEGWAKLTNDWPGLACRYEGGPESTSVRLELGAADGLVKGSVAIDLPPETGSGCPPLRKRYAVAETIQGPGTLSFVDSGGNEWTLSVRRNATVLQGLLAWRQGGPEQPLAEGFAGPGGQRPAARLSGEVRLRRGAGEAATEEPAAAGPAPESAPAASKPIGAGGHTKNVAIILGANVVGLGLLYGVNKAGKGSSETGVVTCSLRVCIVGATVNDPCFCEGNVVSGAPCGTTEGGAPQNAPCDGVAVPCQSGLSCNSGFCQDRDGRCPW
ncbi:MAG TPA: hypothetical protein VLL75_19875 [Vicinamibacteria bacterium]|nr:hypothetical protein [Vicinamibacteria bacterium]